MSTPPIKPITQIDRLAMSLFRALLDADRQSGNNPMVFWRCFKNGLEDYLHGEGFSADVVKAIDFADKKVQFACFNINPAQVAALAMGRVHGDEQPEDLGGYQDPAYERNGR